MRHLLAALAVLAVTGAACAQYKTPASKPPAPGASTVPVTPNPNVQITPGPTPIEQSMESARRISRADAMKMIAAKKAIYIDVRGKDQYDIEHIKGAISIPLAEFQVRMQEMPKDKFLITYCA